MKKLAKLFLLFFVITASAEQSSLKSTAEKTKSAVYTVKAGYEVHGRAGQGNAVAIGPNLLVTNCHVTQKLPVIWIYQGQKPV